MKNTENFLFSMKWDNKCLRKLNSRHFNNAYHQFFKLSDQLYDIFHRKDNPGKWLGINLGRLNPCFRLCQKIMFSRFFMSIESRDLPVNLMIFEKWQLEHAIRHTKVFNIPINELSIYISGNKKSFNNIYSKVKKLINNGRINSLSLIKDGCAAEIGVKTFLSLMELPFERLRFNNFKITCSLLDCFTFRDYHGNVKILYLTEVRTSFSSLDLMVQLKLLNCEQIFYTSSQSVSYDTELSIFNEKVLKNRSRMTKLSISTPLLYSCCKCRDFKNVTHFYLNGFHPRYTQIRKIAQAVILMKNLRFFVFTAIKLKLDNYILKFLQYLLPSLAKNDENRTNLNIYLKDSISNEPTLARNLIQLFKNIQNYHFKRPLLNEFYLYGCVYSKNDEEWDDIINNYSRICCPYFHLVQFEDL